MAEDGTIVSVNVGRPVQLFWHGRTITTGIWKYPVVGPVAVRSTNLEGDEQADLRVHGGADKAVYAYSVEDSAWWAERLGRAIEPGGFGENLTISGLDLVAALVGDRWQAGSAVLEIAQPRTPCYKLGIRMGDDGFPDHFQAEGRTGAYLRVIRQGSVAAGDAITVLHRRRDSLSLGEVARICHAERHRAAELLALPQLAGSRQAWARRALQLQPGARRVPGRAGMAPPGNIF